jgi:hypothetical protein
MSSRNFLSCSTKTKVFKKRKTQVRNAMTHAIKAAKVCDFCRRRHVSCFYFYPLIISLTLPKSTWRSPRRHGLSGPAQFQYCGLVSIRRPGLEALLHANALWTSRCLSAEAERRRATKSLPGHLPAHVHGLRDQPSEQEAPRAHHGVQDRPLPQQPAVPSISLAARH